MKLVTIALESRSFDWIAGNGEDEAQIELWFIPKKKLEQSYSELWRVREIVVTESLNCFQDIGTQRSEGLDEKSIINDNSKNSLSSSFS